MNKKTKQNNPVARAALLGSGLAFLSVFLLSALFSVVSLKTGDPAGVSFVFSVAASAISCFLGALVAAKQCPLLPFASGMLSCAAPLAAALASALFFKNSYGNPGLVLLIMPLFSFLGTLCALKRKKSPKRSLKKALKR